MMRIRTGRYLKVLTPLVLFFSVLGGCAQNTLQVKPQSPGSPPSAVIQSVSVAGDTEQQRVEIVSSQPVTYTSYKSTDPLKIVLDISQAEAGTVVSPQNINSAQIKQILLTEHNLSGGKLCRVEVYLAKDADFAVSADPSDSNKLIVSFSSVQGNDKPGSVTALPATTEPAKSADTPTKGNNPSTGADKPAMPAEGTDKTEKPAEVAAGSVPPVTVADPPQKASQDAGAAGGRMLKEISSAKEGIKVSVSGGVSDYKSFRLTKPDRLVIDIPGVKNAIGAKSVALTGSSISLARIGVYHDKIRIVFDSAQATLPEYKIVPGDAGLLISFSGAMEKKEALPAVGKESDSSVAVSPVKEVVPAVTGSSDDQLDSIDFKEADGVSRIVLNVGRDCQVGTPKKSADGITLTIKNCRLPKKLQRPLDTRAFPSPVGSVTPYQVRIKGGTDVRIAVVLKREMPFSLKRDGKLVYLDITNPPEPEAAKLAVVPSAAKTPKKEFVDRPLPEQVQPTEIFPERQMSSARGAGKKVYTGRKVTLEFADADVRKIFQLIAEVSNLNFLIGDDVSGTMSLKLVNVPWDQALDVILETRGLGMQRDGNIVQIKPKSKIQSQDEEDIQAKKARERSMELLTEVFEVNYASISDIEKQFNKLKSERGSVFQDQRTNRVIVKDIAPALGEMRALLKTLDIPEKQVVIEARIVEASSDFTRELGIQWGLHGTNTGGDLLGLSRADIGFGGGVNRDAGTAGTFGPGLAAGFSFGQLINNATLDMKLEAFSLIGQIKVVSTPKVLTLNNKQAKITQGTQVPYATTSAEGTKIEFKAAELTLEVTPHITADGNIIMKIQAKNDSVGTEFAQGPPAINTKQATTEMLVKNGETTVIGGIYLDRDSNSDAGVPFLMDIPLIGGLFKSNQKQKNRSELLIFITPKIVM